MPVCSQGSACINFELGNIFKLNMSTCHGTEEQSDKKKTSTRASSLVLYKSDTLQSIMADSSELLLPCSFLSFFDFCFFSQIIFRFSLLFRTDSIPLHSAWIPPRRKWKQLMDESHRNLSVQTRIEREFLLIQL